MSDFTDSLRNEDDSEIKSFILELFDRVDDLHEKSKTEFEKAYHQGEKDALRRVLAIMTGRDIDLIIPTSVVAHKLRGEIKTIEAELLESLELTQSILLEVLPTLPNSGYGWLQGKVDARLIRNRALIEKAKGEA
jgi:hypothetical protein